MNFPPLDTSGVPTCQIAQPYPGGSFNNHQTFTKRYAGLRGSRVLNVMKAMMRMGPKQCGQISGNTS